MCGLQSTSNINACRGWEFFGLGELVYFFHGPKRLSLVLALSQNAVMLWPRRADIFMPPPNRFCGGFIGITLFVASRRVRLMRRVLANFLKMRIYEALCHNLKYFSVPSNSCQEDKLHRSSKHFHWIMNLSIHKCPFDFFGFGIRERIVLTIETSIFNLTEY